ncbi:MAG: FtsW/RodA/SpoVE family cell cycle protein [Clostridia bacterium]|nr:FtsW/RodA/SpoVE family cell cycle protein [Clostridia bacterium]
MKRKRDPGKPLSRVVTVFYFLAFLLLFVRECYISGFVTAITEHWQALALAFAVPMLNVVTTGVLPRLFPADKLLLSLTNFLCALGILMLYRTNPVYAYQQATYYFVGLLAMVVCIYIVRFIRSWRFLVWPMMLASLALMALPLLIGEEVYGATNWIRIGSLSMQPSEVVKLCLVIIIARFMADHRFFPWLLYAGACLGVLMLQKDLGTALLYFGTTLLVYYAASGNLLITGLGAAAGAGAAVMGYSMFSHVRRRVSVWLDPWKDYNDAGYQIIQSLMAIASGGLFGVGLGLGSPTIIPVYHTDFIFAVICEQFGLIFGLCVLLMYAAIILRGAATAMAARSRFHGLLAMGCTVLLGLQTFVIIGGVLKLIPLTGVTMPFVSYGGTSLVSSLCLVGLLQGVSSLNEDSIAQDTRLATYGE